MRRTERLPLVPKEKPKDIKELHKCMFIPKTFDMVSVNFCKQNPEYSKIISWSEAGDEIEIKSISQLCTQVLPHYFNHKSYQSFIRQLNKYGFEKVRVSPLSYDIYRNPYFIKGRKDLLSKIVMKRPDPNAKVTRRRNSIEGVFYFHQGNQDGADISVKLERDVTKID